MTLLTGPSTYPKLRKMDARMERRANKFLVNRIMWVVIETGCPTGVSGCILFCDDLQANWYSQS